MSDIEIFDQVFEQLKKNHPYAGLEMHGSLIYVKGECVFNTEGYNLLFNLTRLCNSLSKELG